MMRLAVMLALVVSAFVSTASAQQRATPTLTSEDLLDRRSAYTPASSMSNMPRADSSSAGTPVGGLYRDPSGAFSLSLPSGSWRVITKSQDKGKLSDPRVFRKLDNEGFASATASVYVLSSTTGLSVERVAGLSADGQRSLAEALAARFLSSNSSIISASAEAAGSGASFQVIADQLVSRRAVVRALITAFEHEGRIYVVICRAPVESFDAQAPEFSAITRSLASSVARSS
jgi:hypothetical protein